MGFCGNSGFWLGCLGRVSEHPFVAKMSFLHPSAYVFVIIRLASSIILKKFFLSRVQILKFWLTNYKKLLFDKGKIHRVQYLFALERRSALRVSHVFSIEETSKNSCSTRALFSCIHLISFMADKCSISSSLSKYCLMRDILNQLLGFASSVGATLSCIWSLSFVKSQLRVGPVSCRDASVVTTPLEFEFVIW